jgi:hypothetical protein
VQRIVIGKESCPLSSAGFLRCNYAAQRKHY